MTHIETISVYAPLMNPNQYENAFEPLENTLQELTKLSGKLHLQFKGELICPIYISVLSSKAKEVSDLFTDTWMPDHIDTILKFSYRVSVLGIDELKQIKQKIKSLKHHAERNTQHLLIYLNLAKPGAFDSREGIITETIYNDKKPISVEKFSMVAHSIGHAIDVSSKHLWPKLRCLPIPTTLKWLREHWTAFETISNSPIQRALNAFSYLFTNSISQNDFSSGDLFHALIGIEAIYVKGNSNILSQVNSKSQLLLGPRSEYKKILNQLYDYRSRYIHGQLNFINKYRSDGWSKDGDDQMLKNYDHSALAMAILIASIQKHIELDKGGFDFEYRLRT